MFKEKKTVRALQTAMDYHPIGGRGVAILGVVRRYARTGNLGYRVPIYRKTGEGVASSMRSVTHSRDLTQNTTATATRTPLNERFNEQNNGHARAL